MTDFHFDVLIVGAGISGIGAAYHLQHQCPDHSFAILEAQSGMGGTWRTHRYPGIRSDSDLFTFGYRFKPWTGPPIASAAEILTYLQEVIDDNGLEAHIRYSHRIDKAEWSSEDNRWTLEATNTGTAEKLRCSANFLWMCQGYYRHDEGYTPEWPGMDDFGGAIVHPQHWPDDLNYRDKRVIVIGSGATAATLVPAIAGDCAKVTMLQRSPTYFIAQRNANDLADTLRELDIDPAWIHEIVRRKILVDQRNFTRRCFEEPDVVAMELKAMAQNYLGEDYPIDPHFSPRYLPWRQRVAFVPDGDLFKAIAKGDAEVVTDEIDRFTARGIALKSGETLEADIIVSATGFQMNVMGDIDFSVDGAPLNFHDTVTYRGMMFTGVPNLAWIFGYFRASWTLRVDLVADFVCNLLNHMRAEGLGRVEPQLRPGELDMPLLPWVDPEDFNPGYVTRADGLLPKRGDRRDWQHSQDYWSEKDEFARIDLTDSAFRYS